MITPDIRFHKKEIKFVNLVYEIDFYRPDPITKSKVFLRVYTVSAVVGNV